MKSIIRVSAAFVALLMLAACATKPAIPFDSTSAGEIKTIGILTPSMPSGPSAILASSVGQSFGLVGALIDAGMQESRESDLEDLLNSKEFVAYNKLMSGVTASLEAQGYTVKNIAVTRAERDFMKVYPSSNPEQVDAYLDMVMNGYGYIAAGVTSGTPYRPIVVTKVRLVSARDSSVLMEDVVYYNRLNSSVETTNVTIAPDPAYSFPDFSDLESDPNKTVEGLDLAFAKSTEAIGTLLR